MPGFELKLVPVDGDNGGCPLDREEKEDTAVDDDGDKDDDAEADADLRMAMVAVVVADEEFDDIVLVMGVGLFLPCCRCCDVITASDEAACDGEVGDSGGAPNVTDGRSGEYGTTPAVPKPALLPPLFCIINCERKSSQC